MDYFIILILWMLVNLLFWGLVFASCSKNNACGSTWSALLFAVLLLCPLPLLLQWGGPLVFYVVGPLKVSTWTSFLFSLSFLSSRVLPVIGYQPSRRYHSRGMSHKGETKNSLHSDLSDLYHPCFDYFLRRAAIAISKSHQHLEDHLIYGTLPGDMLCETLKQNNYSMTIPPIISGYPWGIKHPPS